MISIFTFGQRKKCFTHLSVTSSQPFFLFRYMDDVLGQGAEILQSLQVFSLFNNWKF